jgi:putative transposase
VKGARVLVGGAVDTGGMSDRDVISDEAWAFIAPLLPSSVGRRGGQWRDHRQVMEGIAWRYRTGSPWRNLPARFGPWQTVWKRHNRWSADGTWGRLVTAARAHADATGDLDWLVAVDWHDRAGASARRRRSPRPWSHGERGRITRLRGLTSRPITRRATRVAG